MVPRMETGQEKREPSAEDLPRHPRPPERVPNNAEMRLRAGNAILPQQFEHTLVTAREELHRRADHHQRLDLPALPACPVARGVQPGVIGDALMLDFLSGMPAPQGGGLLVPARQMARVGDQLVRQHRGEMFERHRCRQARDCRAALGQRQRLVDMPVEQRHVIPLISNVAVERDMLARVDHFLLDERLDFGVKARRRAFAESADAIDEKALALGESDRQRVIESGREWIVVQPPTAHLRAAAKAQVARDDRQIGGSGCFRHEKLQTDRNNRPQTMFYLHQCQ